MYGKPPCPRFGEGGALGPLYAVPSASGTAELRPKAPRSLPPPPRTPKPNPAPRCGPPRPGRGASPPAAPAAASRPFPVLPRPPGRAGCPGGPAAPRHPPAQLRAHLVPPPGPLLPPPALALTPALGRAAAASPAGPPAAAAALAASREPAARGEEVRGGEKPLARAPSQPSPPPPAPGPALTGRAGGAGGGVPPGSTPLPGTERGRAPRTASGELGASAWLRREFGGGAERSGAAMSRLLSLRRTAPGAPRVPRVRKCAAGRCRGEGDHHPLLFPHQGNGVVFQFARKTSFQPLLCVVPRYLNLMRYRRCQRPVAPKHSILGSAEAVPCCVAVRTRVTAHFLYSRERAIYLDLKKRECRKIN